MSLGQLTIDGRPAHDAIAARLHRMMNKVQRRKRYVRQYRREYYARRGMNLPRNWAELHIHWTEQHIR